MKVYTSVVLLLLGSVFAIAAAGPISEASIKGMISEVLSQEVQYNAINAGKRVILHDPCIMSRPGS